MQTALEYAKWDNFKKVLDKAIEACKGSNHAVSDHFAEVGKMIDLAKTAQRSVEDYHLSRYACYLIVQNGDPRKKVIALGQTYFAVKTRQQELAANLFRATQTEAKLKRENIQGKDKANATHHEVGAKVRETIKELGGTMSEDLPTPNKSIKQLEREEKKKLNSCFIFHYAITGHTAAEIIYQSADHTRDHMGLTSWKNAPDG